MKTMWTLEELAEESLRYLGDESEGDSRRVQWRPNPRQIRYYATLGLLDKPETENGRTVWYGPKHLLQLLAIKKLQGEGGKLAEIQAALAGLSSDALREKAGLPASFLSGLHNSVTTAPRRATAFWAERPETAEASLPIFTTAWRLEIAPGVALTIDDTPLSGLGRAERESLASAFLQTWQTYQSQNGSTKEQP